MNKNEIDEQAEREANAIRRINRENYSRKYMSNRTQRIIQSTDYNKAMFDKLFRG